ncbi:putative acetyltransferase [uncultured Roseburia sp.]|uniref:GNAT family N-acetyltransferase n=1 Tax=Brotonthovivens ammoniilytica TaxID=2981725 RepID=A0ABT2TL80_9FIRM|nr:GNAT family N-acetyltransferase [Brotonthovivens ammoniilytica]MCU6762963.1 GNAT family N-acetyltransferase [Brotonthovivens ammoniilytica]SCI95037.1 putative acetyltransferase [uncultured Roseburia sp.]
MEKILLPESSFSDLCQFISDTEGKMVQTGKGYRFYNVETSRWSNRFCLDKMDEDTVPYIIEGIRIHKPGLISYTKECVPENVAGTLRELGYEVRKEQTGMLFHIEENFKISEKDLSPNIEQINADRLKEWCDVTAEAFPKPSEYPAFRMLMERHPEKLAFFGYVEQGKIIGTIMVYKKGPNPGIHEVAVLPDQRGKGIARKLVMAALEECRMEGFRMASLQASEMGRGLYEHLGFEAVSTLVIWNQV